MSDHLPAHTNNGQPPTHHGNLKPRQAAFVHEFTADHNATQAAIRAGYAPRSAATTGARLLRNDKVRAAIDEREQRLADELGLTAQWALERLAEVVRISMTPTPKTYQGGIVRAPCDDEGCDGCPHVVYEIDAGSAHAALRTLMQHRGMLTERSHVMLESVRYELIGVDVDALR